MTQEVEVTYRLNILPVTRMIRGLYGADDGPSGQEGTSPNGVNTTDTVTITPNKADTFDREYVERLRRENAETRKNAEALANALKEKEDAEAARAQAEMSEIEAAKAAADTERKLREAAEASVHVLRVNSALSNAARDKKFRDPNDLKPHISQSVLDGLKFDDKGEITSGGADLERAIAKIAETKPYLLETETSNPGNGDGGALKPPAKPDSHQALVEKYKNEFVEKGRVPVA